MTPPVPRPAQGGSRPLGRRASYDAPGMRLSTIVINVVADVHG
ncbi:hypothetical protein QQY66_33100 [Streptomyces sp. DG2A-72]|nr:hypothetical protein [Streptomyces sp. DG2A-72]MDO0936309.1 hypothetical protein [Streptomyces sp. DG2A-72]